MNNDGTWIDEDDGKLLATSYHIPVSCIRCRVTTYFYIVHRVWNDTWCYEYEVSHPCVEPEKGRRG